MRKLKPRAGLALCALMIWTANANADAVTDWNEITMAAVTASQPGPEGMLDAALVHVAIHDAIQAIETQYEPYQVEIRGAKGSRSAATAAAARGVLAGLYPAENKVAALDAAYDDYLARNGLSNDPGLEVGRKVAAAILPLRHRAVRAPARPDLVSSRADNAFADWNGTLRKVAKKRVRRIGDSARLFAVANVAQYEHDGQCRLGPPRQYTEQSRIEFRCKQTRPAHLTLLAKNRD